MRLYNTYFSFKLDLSPTLDAGSPSARTALFKGDDGVMDSIGFTWISRVDASIDVEVVEVRDGVVYTLASWVEVDDVDVDVDELDAEVAGPSREFTRSSRFWR